MMELEFVSEPIERSVNRFGKGSVMVVLPKHLVKVLGWNPKDVVEIRLVKIRNKIGLLVVKKNEAHSKSFY